MKRKSKSLNFGNPFLPYIFQNQSLSNGGIDFLLGFLIISFSLTPFYFRAPLSVNLKAKDLAKELEKHIQGTTLPVNNKGCC